MYLVRKIVPCVIMVLRMSIIYFLLVQMLSLFGRRLAFLARQEASDFGAVFFNLLEMLSSSKKNTFFYDILGHLEENE